MPCATGARALATVAVHGGRAYPAEVGALSNEQQARIAGAARAAGVDLLVLFGSRARGDATAGSDWDFGFLATGEADEPSLVAAVVTALGSDRVDLVDLGRAGALIRFRAARDGVPLFERAPRSHERFQLEAATFWCDVEPVLRDAYERLLDSVGT